MQKPSYHGTITDVTTRIASLISPPIGFAHRGGKAHAPENTLSAFATAIEMGATGIETDAWVTVDGDIVLIHEGSIRRKPWLPGWLLGQPISKQKHNQLPDHVPTLVEYYQRFGTSLQLSIDIKDTAAFSGIVATACDHKALERLWICHEDLALLALWRKVSSEARLVHSVRRDQLPNGHERHAADLAELGIDAVNLRRRSWNGGLITLYHRFNVLAFAWDAQQMHHIEELIDSGIDAICSEHVDRLTKALNHFS